MLCSDPHLPTSSSTRTGPTLIRAFHQKCLSSAAVHGDRNRERFVTDTCTASNQSEIALNSFFMRNIWSCCSSKDEDLEALRELLHDGVDVDSKNDLGETPLLLASSRGLERMTTVRFRAEISPTSRRPVSSLKLTTRTLL